MGDPETLPNSDRPASNTKLDEQKKLEFEYYKAKLDYRKFVLGSVFVAIAIAAIPPLFQLATAVLEYVKTEQQLRMDQANRDADRQAKQQEFRDGYIKDFLSNALSQDIELRIRFAEYFAHVSAEIYKQDWVAYHNDLVEHRDKVRGQIDKMEGDWRHVMQTKEQNEAEIDRLDRNLAWAYKEVGYVERNRSVAINPRAPEARPVSVGSALTADTLIQLFEKLRGRKEDLQALLDAAAEFGVKDQNDMAAFMAATLHESAFLTVESENLDYPAQRLMAVWPTKFPDLETARKYEHKPEQLGNFIYGGRMGNTEPGDGYKYRGRGYMQITGREAYRQIGEGLGIGSVLEDNPDKLVQDRKLNARAAAFYYSRETAALRAQGRVDDLVTVWRRLTGGLNGIGEGTAIYNRLVRGPA